MTASTNVKPRQLRSLVLLLILLPLVPVIVNFRFMAETIHTERESVREKFTLLYANHLDSAAHLFERQLLSEIEDFPLEEQEILAEMTARKMDSVLILAEGRVLHQLGNTHITKHLDLETLRQWPLRKWQLCAIRGYYLLRNDQEGHACFFLRRTVVLGREATTFFQSAFGVEPPIWVTSVEGRVFPASEPAGEAFTTKILSGILPGWEVSLFTAPDAFWVATLSEQIAAYRRIGVALMLGVLLVSALAGYAVTRQMHLNEMQLTSVAAIAHELKTPLSSMRLLLETLTSGRIQDGQPQREYVELIQKENRRLGTVVESFLTLLRMQNRDYKPRLRVSHPSEFVPAAIETVKVRLDELGFSLEITEDGNDPEIMTDPEAMRTALVNLLENAIKYSTDTKTITLSINTRDSWLFIGVKDSGIGLSKQELRHIFRPFYQVDSRLSRRREGTGLGLSIVRRIVRAHKGRIEVSSEPGKGSLFLIRLPILK